jgi:hypothetical protein
MTFVAYAWNQRAISSFLALIIFVQIVLKSGKVSYAY